MLFLDKKSFISKGAFRYVYNHPADSNKIIKIDIQDKNGNKREIEAYNKFNQSIKNFTPKFFGEIETNLGKGLIFEKIYDYDSKKPSKKILEYININKDEAIILKKTIIQDVEKLFNAFANNLIFTTSFGLENILVQKISKNKIKIYTIDFKIQKHKEFIPITKIPFFLKLKIKRREKRLIKMLISEFDKI